MIYHLLDEVIYSNSRYELMTLLEDICPTRKGKLESSYVFAVIASTYEKLLDDYFPALPFSEERLAIFLRVYSDRGIVSQELIRAVESGSRAAIVVALRHVDIGDASADIALICRRFYEATIFGDE